MSGLYVNIGASSLQAPGWVNLDRVPLPGVQVCDVRLGLPFGDAAVDAAVCSHMLEHVHPFKEALPFLRDVQRVLKPEGVFRVAVPDLAKLVDAYALPKGQLAARLAESQKGLGDYVGVAYADMPAALRFSAICFGNNSGMPAYDGHQVCYDAEALRWLLVDVVGFRDFAVVSPTESKCAELLRTYRDVGAPEEIVVEVCR